LKESRQNRVRLVTVVAILLLIATTGVSQAVATTLMRMSLSQMARAAKVIVRARCVANSTVWDEGEIWTRTTFDVEESWTGPPGSRQIAVRLLGGSLGKITSHVSGIPRFQPGEDTVLFLEASRNGDFAIVSWQQGTFRIRPNAAMGGEIVVQDTAASALTYDPVTRRFEAAGIPAMALADFRSQVVAALGPSSSRKP
jgi:hypothetical protein